MGSFLKIFWPPVVVALSASAAFSGYMLNGVPVRDLVFGLWNTLYWVTVIMWIAAAAQNPLLRFQLPRLGDYLRFNSMVCDQ